MIIDRCVCFNQKFSDLLCIAKKKDCKSIQDLQSYCNFGLNCCKCLPYIAKMIETEEVIFYDLIPPKET